MHPDSLLVWRDHDGEALQLGESMRLDSVALDTDADLLAGNVFDAGGRLVVINEIIDFDDLDPVNSVRFFELLRELTSYGISVGWRMRASRDDTRWRDLWHLFPPSEVEITGGAAGPTWEFWRQQFYFGLCTMRRGPGIIEVRDRRVGRIRRLSFTSPLHLEAIERLERGASASSVAPEVLAEFEEARVVMALGGMRLWLPCRTRRSPLSPIVFW
jgi:Family of unknown function (DUF5825)